jgi:hypothetical protein
VSEKVEASLVLVRGVDAPPLGWELELASVDAIIAFRPEDCVNHLPPRPVVLVAMEDDELMPLYEVERLYALLPGPKEKLVFPGSHSDLYRDDVLPTVTEQTLVALRRLLPSTS